MKGDTALPLTLLGAAAGNMHHLSNFGLTAWLIIDAWRCLRNVSHDLSGATDLLSGISLLMLAFLVLLRPAPTPSRSSPTTWAIVLATVFLPLVYTLLPAHGTSEVAVALRFISVIGFAWSMLYLRCNFSVLPQHRMIVTTGPYNLARHPIYGCYLLFDATLCLPGDGNLLPCLFGIEILLMYARARQEETCLIAADPAYETYRRQVRSRFLPGLF